MVKMDLNRTEWEHILFLIENDVKYGRSMFETRFNIMIYDKIYDCLQKADEENTLNE